MACKNETVNTIFKALDDKKARDIEVLDVSSLTTLADYFILATGGSDRQVQALCDHVEDELGKRGIHPVNKRATAPVNGCFWDMTTPLCIYSRVRPGIFIIWSESGRMQAGSK